MGYSRHFFYTHRLYSTLNLNILQDYKRKLSRSGYRLAYLLTKIPREYQLELFKDSDIVWAINDHIHNFPKDTYLFPLESLDSPELIELLTDRFKLRHRVPPFQSDSFPENADFTRKFVSIPGALHKIFRVMDKKDILSFGTIVQEALLNVPVYLQEFQEYAADWVGPEFNLANTETQDKLLTQEARQEIKEDLLTKKSRFDEDIPYVLVDYIFDDPKILPVLKTDIEYGALKHLSRKVHDKIVKKPAVQNIIKEIVLETGQIIPFTTEVQLSLLEDPEVMDLAIKNTESYEDYKNFSQEVREALVEHGIFSDPAHSIHTEPEKDYPEDISHDKVLLLRYMDKKGIESISIEDLKKQGFFNVEELKDLYLRHNTKNKLSYQDILDYGTSEKIELPESFHQDTLDFRNSILNKGKTKHQTWTGDQRIFPETNHIFLWSLQEDLVPDSYWDTTPNDIMSTDELEAYAEARDVEDVEDILHVSIPEEYIEKTTHPGIANHLTLGWIRYTLGKDITEEDEESSIWIDEIQTDLHVIFGREKAQDLIPSAKFMYVLMTKFIKFIRSQGFEKIYMPNHQTATQLYNRAKPPKSTYHDLPRRLRFKKETLTDFHDKINGKSVWVLANYSIGAGMTDKITQEIEKLVVKASDYKIYHRSYTEAIQEMEKYITKKGYELDPEEQFQVIGSGPGKPRPGSTNRHTLLLWKNKKPAKKAVHLQVYGRDDSDASPYELNMYLSAASIADYTKDILE